MKRFCESKAVLSEVIQPSQANSIGTLHGGEIMKIMDSCGAVAAKRHSRTDIATVRVDELVFYKAVFVGELVTCEAQLVFTGRTSMEVKITVIAEDPKNEYSVRTALKAFFTYVAIDSNRKPCAVEPLIAETEEEKAEFEEGRVRYIERKQKRLQEKR